MKTRAAVAWEAGRDLEIEEIDVDGPKEGEVLVRVVATGLRRHAYSDACATAGLSLLATLCRWQPRVALLLRASHAIAPALAITGRALDKSRHALLLSASDLLHALAVLIHRAQSKSSMRVIDVQLEDLVEKAERVLVMSPQIPKDSCIH